MVEKEWRKTNWSTSFRRPVGKISSNDDSSRGPATKRLSSNDIWVTRESLSQNDEGPVEAVVGPTQACQKVKTREDWNYVATH